MATVLRSLALAAVVATSAVPLWAQRSAAPPPGPAVPAVPPMPPGPHVEQFGDSFGRAMGAWGESLGQRMGTLGDSLGKLGSQLGAAQSEAATNPSRANRAHVDSIERAMRDVERAMGHAGGRGHDWRDFARHARQSALTARANALHGANGMRDLIDRVRRDPEAVALPPADSFTTGAINVPAGSNRIGTAAAVDGNIDVYGMVTGNADAVDGNVEIHPGGHVTGNVFAAGGVVRLDSGAVVDGEIRSLAGDFGATPTSIAHMPLGATSSRWRDFRIALTAFALLLMLGIGVLTFAEEQLDHVTSTLRDHFGRSAWYGLVGEIAFAPVLALITLALIITVVGILIVPFAAAAYAALGVGAGTLGFIAVAEATGTAILRTHTQASLTPRGAQLRAIVTGIAVYGGMWVLSAVLGDTTGVGLGVRSIVVTVTVVAVTVGYGAVLLWRFDVRRANRLAAATARTPVDEAVWQTPTPVSGVAAARRTTPAGVAQTSEKSS